MHLKMSCYQLKIDCYNYKILHISLMVTTKWKPIVDTQRMKESKHATSEKSIKLQRKRRREEERSKGTTN